MLTPAFDLSQDATYLRVVIKARYANLAEVEVFVDGDDFKFYSKPYFLRLQLPGRVVEDGREKAKYDVDTGAFEILLPKETPGQVFEGLDMLTKLLAPRGQRSAEQPGIEIAGDAEAEAQCQEPGDAQGEVDWQVEQRPFRQEEDALWGEAAYGFAHKRSGVFQRLQEELCGVIDLPNPDTAQVAERKQARIAAEDQKFDADHYLADLYGDDSCLADLLDHKPPWHQEWRRRQKDESTGSGASGSDQTPGLDEDLGKLTEEEKEQLRRLPRRHHLLDGETERAALLSLVDILFAYAYNARTTLGENSVESAWTICKLSPTLSWLDWFACLDEVVVACYRRALCYPLYRQWELAAKVCQDVRRIFQLGRRRILKCLLEVQRLLAADEPRYVLNELYITDYCVWVQSLQPAVIDSLAAALKKVKMTKSRVGFELAELEEAAEMATLDPSGREAEAAAAVHQYGYPNLLREARASDDASREKARNEEPTSSPTERNEGRRSNEVIGASGVDRVDPEVGVEGVASELSNLELSEEIEDSAEGPPPPPPPGNLSAEDWARKPPTGRIEMFEEAVMGFSSVTHSELEENTERSEHGQGQSQATEADKLPGESSCLAAGILNRDPKVDGGLPGPRPSETAGQSAIIGPEHIGQAVNLVEEAQSDSDSTDSDSDSETDSDSNSETDSDSDSENDSDSVSGPSVDIGHESKPGPSSDSGLCVDLGSGTDSPPSSRS